MNNKTDSYLDKDYHEGKINLYTISDKWVRFPRFSFVVWWLITVYLVPFVLEIFLGLALTVYEGKITPEILYGFFDIKNYLAFAGFWFYSLIPFCLCAVFAGIYGASQKHAVKCMLSSAAITLGVMLPMIVFGLAVDLKVSYQRSAVYTIIAIAASVSFVFSGIGFIIGRIKDKIKRKKNNKTLANEK